ncbi:MAG: S1C family serine protease [Planctomycetota bacterium]
MGSAEMRWIPVLLTGSLLFGAAAEPAAAQESTGSRSALLRRAFRDVGARHRLSTGKVEIRVRTGRRLKWVPAGYATVVSDEGHLLGVSDRLPDGTPIRVFLASENPYDARVTARDGRWNLAALKIESEEWTEALDFSESNRSAAGVGEWAISLGIRPTPLNVGALSALGRAVIEQPDPTDQERLLNPALRSVYGGRRYREVLQHDTALARDQLGAPMVDSRGRVIGITVETRSRGTNYAVPAHRIAEALPALLRGKSTAATRPGFIGIQAGRLTNDQAKALGIPGGVPVSSIIGRGGQPTTDPALMYGAGKAGVRVGDVITKVDGRRVLDIQTLQEIVQLFDPGEQVVFTVLRDSKSIEFTVTIAAKTR